MHLGGAIALSLRWCTFSSILHPFIDYQLDSYVKQMVTNVKYCTLRRLTVNVLCYLDIYIILLEYMNITFYEAVFIVSENIVKFDMNHVEKNFNVDYMIILITIDL